MTQKYKYPAQSEQKGLRDIYFEERIYVSDQKMIVVDGRVVYDTSTPVTIYSVHGSHNFRDGEDVTDKYKLEEQFWEGASWWPTFHLVDGKVKEGTKTRIVAIPIEPPTPTGSEGKEDWIRLRDCYNKYISLLAEQLFQFRKLAKEIHQWATEKSLEKKTRALDRLETEFYQLSITPESTEIINTRKDLADALAAIELYRTSSSTPSTADQKFSREDMEKCWDAAVDYCNTGLGDNTPNKETFINSLKEK